MRLLGLLVGLAICSAAHAATIDGVAEMASATVVKVHARYSNGSIAQGSAVIVGPEKLVTNCHVVHAASRIEVVQHETARTATLQAQDLSRDLCYLRAPGIARAAPRRHAELAIGQRVFAAGFPADGALTISDGRVIALHNHEGAEVIQVSAPFDHGSSGGALFDEYGRLVGIVTFKARAGGRFHFALPVAWLDVLASGEKQPSSEPTLPFWQRRGDELPYFLRAVSLEAAASSFPGTSRQSPSMPD